MTGEEWDTHWYRIYSEATPVGMTDAEAAEVADRETVEQFGSRPEDVAS